MEKFMVILFWFVVGISLNQKQNIPNFIESTTQPCPNWAKLSGLSTQNSAEDILLRFWQRPSHLNLENVWCPALTVALTKSPNCKARHLFGLLYFTARIVIALLMNALTLPLISWNFLPISSSRFCYADYATEWVAEMWRNSSWCMALNSLTRLRGIGKNGLHRSSLMNWEPEQREGGQNLACR